MASIIEMEPCGRCGGSGRYSFNYMDGDRCYGCGGKGQRMTKRGAFINKELIASREVHVKNVKIGMVVEATTITVGGRGTARMKMFVKAVGEPKVIGQGSSGNEPLHDIININFDLESKSGYTIAYGMGVDSKIMAAVTNETMPIRAEFVQKAMDLITKMGKVRKGKEQDWESLCQWLRENTKFATFASIDEWKNPSN